MIAVARLPVAHPDALRQIGESEAERAAAYPPEVRSAFPPGQPIAARGVFVVARIEGAAVGCGGLAPSRAMAS